MYGRRRSTLLLRFAYESKPRGGKLIFFRGMFAADGFLALWCQVCGGTICSATIQKRPWGVEVGSSHYTDLHLVNLTLKLTAALSIVLWKVLSWPSRRSTSLPLVVTCPEVCPSASFSPQIFRAEVYRLRLAPALVGNVVVWKPSPAATYSNYIIHQIFAEAGMPAGVIQFVPGPPPEVVAQAISHPSFAGLHFTGSTFIFKKLWKDIAANLDIYKGYPRIVGETGGKNFHVIHESAEIRNAVIQSVRGAFEYQGTCQLWWYVFGTFFTCFRMQVKNVLRFPVFTSRPPRGMLGLRISCWQRLRRSRSDRLRTGATLWDPSCVWFPRYIVIFQSDGYPLSVQRTTCV